MPASIDWPPTSAGRIRRRFFLIILLIAIIFLWGGRSALAYYIDSLWFASLGYAGVFFTTLRVEWSIFVVFAAATWLILYGWFLALKRAHLPDLPSSRTIFLAGEPIQLPIEPVLRLSGLGVCLVVAVATGISAMGDWAMLGLFWYAPHAASQIVDPIFNKALSFYLFTLPAWQLIVNWLMSLAVITCLMALFFLFLAGGTRALARPRNACRAPFPWRGLSTAFAFLLLTLAIRVYVDRFARLFQEHTIFSGVNYTDAHVSLGGMLVVSIALLIGAVIALLVGVLKARARWLVASIVPAAVCYIAVQFSAWYVSSFIVKPNELVREQPYITH